MCRRCVDVLAWKVCNETVVWRTFEYHGTFVEAVWTTPVTPAFRQQGDESVVDRWDGKLPIGPGTASATRRTGVREITDAGCPVTSLLSVGSVLSKEWTCSQSRMGCNGGKGTVCAGGCWGVIIWQASPPLRTLSWWRLLMNFG